MGGETDAGGEHRGGELGDQRCAVAAELYRAFAAGAFGLFGVDGALAVLVGELRDQLQELYPGLELALVQRVDLIEEPALA